MLSEIQSKKHILTLLEGKVHDPNEFCQWLKKYDAFIAGSFALQGKTGQSFVGSDIDIYVSDAMFTSDINIKGNNFDTKCLNIFSKLGCAMNFCVNNDFYDGLSSFIGNHHMYETNDITKIANYILNETIEKCKECKYQNKIRGSCCFDHTINKTKSTKIQIIFINHHKYKNPKEFVKQFDLDFCKVIFDGETYEVLHPDSVKTKTSVYNRISDWKNAKKDRIKKYESRGYIIKKFETLNNNNKEDL